MIIDTNKNRGRAGLSLAIAYFGTNGYTICLPMNDTQWYDLIVKKDGIFQTVQCKFTASKEKFIDFRSTDGTNGKIYDNILNHNLDLLFCADNEQNLFVIPMKIIKENGVSSGIVLRVKKSIYANKNTFDTSPFLVHI